MVTTESRPRPHLLRRLCSLPVSLLGGFLLFCSAITALKAGLDTTAGDSAGGPLLIVLALILGTLGMGLWKLGDKIAGNARSEEGEPNVT